MNRIVALVPMRHDSQRIRGKNYRNFAGKPLYRHIVETLLSTRSVTEVVIDTDSPVILEEVAKLYPQVRLLLRPDHLRDGHTPMNEVLLHTTGQVPADFYVQTHSTNPLLKAETVDRAVDQLLAAFPAYDSLFSVTRLQTRLWDQLARPINHNEAILLRTQDLPPVYEENSCLYIFKRDALIHRRNRLGERPMMLEIDPLEARDIDEEVDFILAEQLHQILRQEHQHEL